MKYLARLRRGVGERKGFGLSCVHVYGIYGNANVNRRQFDYDKDVSIVAR